MDNSDSDDGLPSLVSSSDEAPANNDDSEDSSQDDRTMIGRPNAWNTPRMWWLAVAAMIEQLAVSDGPRASPNFLQPVLDTGLFDFMDDRYLSSPMR